MEKLSRECNLHKDFTEQKEQAEYSCQVTLFVYQSRYVKQCQAANISAALDIKGLSLAHTTCPLCFVRKLFGVGLIQGQRLTEIGNKEGCKVTHWQLIAPA